MRRLPPSPILFQPTPTSCSCGTTTTSAASATSGHRNRTVAQARAAPTNNAQVVRDQSTYNPPRGWLVNGHSHGKPAPRDQTLRSQVAPRSGAAAETERAAEPRGRVEVDARLRAARLW